MSRVRRQKIGFVFQFYNLIPNLNVEENIMLPLLLDGKKMGSYPKRLSEILEIVGLTERRSHTPREWSGGQTIIMVTHSPEAAKSSSRAVTVQDGVIA